MALRKASSYSKRYTRPYTRKSSVKKKSFIKTIPPQKVVKFHMGNTKAFQEGKFKIILKLISEEQIQIRDNALEASRQYLNKEMDTGLAGAYYLAVKVYPHHIMRENKMLTGAGSDRMQTGMQLSFGKTIGRAALVPPNKEIFEIAVENEKGARIARHAFNQIKSKLPCRTRISTEKRV